MIISDALNYFSDNYWYKEKPLASAEILIKEITQCYHSQALIEEAQKTIQELGRASLEIRLEQPTSRFRAETQGSIIRINPNLR
ncbi:MAG: hypothetical protein H0X29_11795, partial [Parachlamydiaceae bacterium]|nr:hypothetical protein [Parachlamydiaceae bacterium]